MANRGLIMSDIRQLLRYFSQGKSLREISSMTGISRKTVTKYISGLQSKGYDYNSVMNISDKELYELLHTSPPADDRLSVLYSEFPSIEGELGRVGVTKTLLWQEYKTRHNDGYNKTQFCQYLNEYLQTQGVVARFEHKFGDKLFVDFAGKKLGYTDRQSCEYISVEVFVAVLGASKLTYVQAVASQKKGDFLDCVEGAFRFIGGVPEAVVPDNLKSAVKKASKYEPELNETFESFAEHYDVAILPTRSRKPRDKALVENAVKLIYQSIYAPLRDKEFYSLDELNAAIAEELEKFNNRKLSNGEFSRRQIFEEYEKSTLRPAAQNRYEIKELYMASVYTSSHIWFGPDKHYYSVPYRFIGKRVKVIYTNSKVEIYYENERIAYHQRNVAKYQYSTIKDHMPSSHNFVHDWSPQRFQSWASSIGIYTRKLIDNIFDSKKHPEQAYKSCLGVLAYAKKIGADILEKSCRRADEYNSYSYRTVKSIIDSKSYNLYNEAEEAVFIGKHDNVRGGDYYQNIS